jgi:hypothetical protein
MKTISNKTQRPLSVPLPRGKTLHLGPGRTGQIASSAADHPELKKLVEAGKIEILGEGSGSTEGAGSDKARGTWMPGHASGGRSRRSGDR